MTNLYFHEEAVIGLYRPSEASGGLKIVVEVAHEFNSSAGDKIRAKLDSWNC